MGVGKAATMTSAPETRVGHLGSKTELVAICYGDNRKLTPVCPQHFVHVQHGGVQWILVDIVEE